jgi:glucose/arabinose dehydrogenase
MCLHPDFAKNKLLYVAYTYRDRGVSVKVVRFRETPQGLVEPKTIVSGIEGGANHDGCRVKFGPDGKLYVTTGERYRKELAQVMSSLNGKTLRLNDDGTIPPDNPFVGKEGVRPEIFSYGHRNAQGMDWQPGTGLMFQTEHGPSGSDAPGGGDEVNIVEAGKDYGWPKVHHRETLAGTVPPLLEYTPAVAPAGGAFYTGSKIPEWKGQFFFANLRGECLIRVKLDGRKVLEEERMFRGELGRLRDVATGPDGYLYFCTSNRDGRGSPASSDDRIFRIVPLPE